MACASTYRVDAPQRRCPRAAERGGANDDVKCDRHVVTTRHQQVVVEELEEVGAVDRSLAGSASLFGSGANSEAVSESALVALCAAVLSAGPGAASGAVDGGSSGAHTSEPSRATCIATGKEDAEPRTAGFRRGGALWWRIIPLINML